MAKYDKLSISGTVQADIDPVVIARVVIMLARAWQERQAAETAPPDETQTSEESEASS